MITSIGENLSTSASLNAARARRMSSVKHTASDTSGELGRPALLPPCLPVGISGPEAGSAGGAGRLEAVYPPP